MHSVAPESRAVAPALRSLCSGGPLRFLPGSEEAEAMLPACRHLPIPVHLGAGNSQNVKSILNILPLLDYSPPALQVPHWNHKRRPFLKARGPQSLRPPSP